MKQGHSLVSHILATMCSTPQERQKEVYDEGGSKGEAAQSMYCPSKMKARQS